MKNLKLRWYLYGLTVMAGIAGGMALWYGGYVHYALALSGDPARQYEYGRWLDERERKQDALMWMKMAADYEPRAMFWMGMAYSKGSGYLMEGGKNASFDWMWAAADQGNVPAMYVLAGMFEYRQIPKDLPDDAAKLDKMALVWYMRSAHFGAEPAIDRLIRVYENGELGEKKSKETAEIWRNSERKPSEYWKALMK